MTVIDATSAVIPFIGMGIDLKKAWSYTINGALRAAGGAG
jgi:hypothetical protein